MLVKELIDKCREYYENGDGVSYLNLVENHQFDFADPIAYYANRANALLLLKQDKEAISSVETALRLYPNDPNSYSNMALIYGSLNQYDKAIPFAKQALKMDKDQLDFKLVLASCYYSDHQYEKALPLYLELNQYEQPFFSYDCELGIIYYYLNDELKANQHLKNAFNVQTLHSFELKIYYQNCIDLALYMDAYEVIDAMISYDPTELLWTIQAELYLLIHCIKDFDTAKKRISKIEKKFPFMRDYCLTQRAYMSFINHRYKKAWEYIDQVQDYDSFKQDYYSTIGLLYWHDGDYKKAIINLKQVNHIVEKTVLTLALVQSYINLNQPKKAYELINLALKYNQYDPTYIKAGELFLECFGQDPFPNKEEA